MRKKAKPAQKQKQNQKQSVTVHVHAHAPRAPRARAPHALAKPSIPHPVHSFSTIHSQDTSSIIAAIRALQYRQPEVIKDVARVDAAEEAAVPLRRRVRAAQLSNRVPSVSGLASQEFYSVLSEPELQPTRIPIAQQPERTIAEAIGAEAGVFEPAHGGFLPSEAAYVKEQSQAYQAQEPIEFYPAEPYALPTELAPSRHREISFTKGSGVFSTVTPRGILESTAQAQFPVPPIELIAEERAAGQAAEFSVAPYVAEPVELLNVTPTVAFPPAQPYQKGGELRAAAEPKEAAAPKSEAKKGTALESNVRAHNAEIKARYASEGRPEKEARKYPL